MNFPLRCPKCNALVVDRRSPCCTTCRAQLPKEFVMNSQQVKRTNAIDLDSRALHQEEMRKIKGTWVDPRYPR